MSTADELVAHLKHFEGFVGHPYFCAAGKLTIGYGHRILDPHHAVLTESAGTLLLLEDIAQYTMAATHFSPNLKNIGGRRLNAIIDFCFNCGPVAYSGSRLRAAINREDWAAAASENAKWVYVTDPKTKQKYVSKWQEARRAVTSAWLREG